MINKSVLVRRICSAIRGQSQMNNSGEEKLMLEIISMAIIDYFGACKTERKSAEIYLFKKTIPHAEVCGIETQFIQNIILKGENALKQEAKQGVNV